MIFSYRLKNLYRRDLKPTRTSSVPANRSLPAVSLSGDPLADVSRTVLEFNAVGFGLRQNLHSLAVHQLYFCECDSHNVASVELSANDLQVFRREPPADAKKQTLFSRNSVDSARHWPPRLSSTTSMANGVPFARD